MQYTGYSSLLALACLEIQLVISRFAHHPPLLLLSVVPGKTQDISKNVQTVTSPAPCSAPLSYYALVASVAVPHRHLQIMSFGSTADFFGQAPRERMFAC